MRDIFYLPYECICAVKANIELRPLYREWCETNLRGFEVIEYRITTNDKSWRMGLRIHHEDDIILVMSRWAGLMLGPFTEKEMRCTWLPGWENGWLDSRA